MLLFVANVTICCYLSFRGKGWDRYTPSRTRFSNGLADNRSKVSVIKYQIGFVVINFRDLSSYVCEIILWMAKSGILDLGKGGILKTSFFLRVFEKWDPGIFPKSQISKISCSSHSNNTHIKLNLDFSCRAERCGPPFIFFMGWMLRFGRNGSSRAVYPPWWGNR